MNERYISPDLMILELLPEEIVCTSADPLQEENFEW